MPVLSPLFLCPASGRDCLGRFSLGTSHCPSGRFRELFVDWPGDFHGLVDQSLARCGNVEKRSLLSSRRRLGPHVCLSGFGSGCCPGWAPSMGSGHCTLRKCLSLCPKHPPQQGAHSLGWPK